VRKAATLKSFAIATVFPSSSSSIGASSDTGTGITVQVLNNVDALRDVSSEWERLWRQTPEVSAFQAPEWILACAEHGGDPDIFAMVLRTGGQPLAIFPTQLSARGTLSFIGAELSNYCGPVYVPGALPPIMTSWRDAVSADPRIRAIDLSGLRERSPFLRLLARTNFPKWGEPVVVEMFTCPEVDLHEAWDKVLRKHKARQRANWRRKWDSLAALGRLEFLETSDPDELATTFPRLFELYEARWRGKRVRGAFGQEQYRLQLEAAKGLGAKGLVKLSLMRLDGEVIAFAYAMRGVTDSTSYVLAHNAAFDVFSPGMLLLINVLEAAAARGDGCYDFSLGDDSYKTVWATGEHRVFSALLGRGTLFTAMKRGCWRTARSIPVLRRLKQEGLRRLAVRKDRSKSLADQPGLSAGTAGAWHVYQIQDEPQSGSQLLHRPLRYSEMQALFSPQLLALALDRHYRGDQALAVEREGSVIGAIWSAAEQRRSIVTGGYPCPSELGPVYYHPVVVQGGDIQQVALSVASGESVVVSPRPLKGEEIRESHTFQADLRFHL
jgi:CelD/BcsL family acetyltransferase involved in cellulose biosynthesis